MHYLCTCYSRFCTITFGVQVHTMYLLLRIKSDCMIVNNYFTVCKHRQPLQLELYQSGLSICTLGSVKVSKSQKQFFLKLHCPKNYEARAEFCGILRSFFNIYLVGFFARYKSVIFNFNQLKSTYSNSAHIL